jgi:hypothetical protein
MTVHSSTASASSSGVPFTFQPSEYSTVLPQGVPTTTHETTRTISTSSSSSHSTPLSATASPPAPTAKQTQDLSKEAKIGLEVSLGILALALALLVMVDWFYLRKRRQERALVNAVHEVERGGFKGSEERIVLESRVSIVFDEDSTDDEEEEERGRHGMSLPRRL